MEHVKLLLSAFMDGQLPAAERSRVEAHLAACPDCARELEGLRGVSRLVASLPQKPLPVGFFQRLEKRRRAAEEPKPAYFLPFPARVAAFALSGLVVSLVVYDGARGRLATVSLQEQMPVARSKADESAAERKRAPGSPIGVADEAPPAPAAPKHTNESLQAFLEKEKKRLGITAIVPPGQAERAPLRELDPASEPPPMSPQEARAYMRQMADDIARQRRAMAPTPDAVPLGSGTKPDLLAKPEDARVAGGAPMQESAAAGLAAAPSAPPAAAFSDRMTAEPSAARKSVAKASFAQGRGAMGMASSFSGGRAEAPQAEAAPPLSSGAVALRSPEELQSLWRRLGKADAPPAVDFSAEMLVGVVLPQRPRGTRVELLSVRERGGALIVEYREVPGDGPPAPASAFRVAPRSPLPAAAERRP